MRVGVAIPCYKHHISILKRCLDSIEAQSRKPDMVVVSCSSCDPDDIPAYSYSFFLRVLTYKECKNAAENRNLAAKALEGCDILSFFDCDDVMHPQRLQCIEEQFTHNPCDILLHNFWLDGECLRPFEEFKSFQAEQNVLRKAPTGCAVVEGRYGLRIHHSQVSVSAFVFGRIQFKEDPGNERREDAIFCGDVLSMPQIQSVYVHNPLSKYNPSGTGGVYA
jgi:glycosyltransferase involved in cell wall biosynthesis